MILSPVALKKSLKFVLIHAFLPILHHSGHILIPEDTVLTNASAFRLYDLHLVHKFSLSVFLFLRLPGTSLPNSEDIAVVVKGKNIALRVRMPGFKYDYMVTCKSFNLLKLCFLIHRLEVTIPVMSIVFGNQH